MQTTPVPARLSKLSAYGADENKRACLLFFFALLAATPERKEVFSFVATFTNNSLNQYAAPNRRTQATLECGSFWQYGYDDRDELTSANRNWPISPAFLKNVDGDFDYPVAMFCVFLIFISSWGLMHLYKSLKTGRILFGIGCRGSQPIGLIVKIAR
jgi:hypothetical protein